MARKKIPWPLDSILPSFEMANRYCYFDDLLRTEGREKNIPLIKHATALHGEAKNNLVLSLQGQLNNKDLESQELETAIKFIGEVAKNEREKEIRVVLQYAEDLKKSLPQILKDKNTDISKLIKELEEFALHPEGKDMKDFYSKLTICINAIRNGATNFKNRLLQLKDTSRTTFADLTQDNMIFRFGSDLEGLLNNLIGIKASRQKDSFSAFLQDLLLEYITDLIAEGKVDENNILSSIIGLLADFGKFLQQYKDEVYGYLKDFADIDKNAIKDLFQNDYLQSNSYFLKSLKQQTSHLLDIDIAAKESIGPRFLEKQKEIEKREKLIEERVNRVSKVEEGKIVNYGAQKLKEIAPEIYEKLQNLDWIHWKTTKNSDSVKQGQHGRLYELIKQALEAAIKVKGSAATDLLVANIGTLEGDISYDFNEIILEQMREIAKDITDFSKKQHKDATDSLTKDFVEMNQSIEDNLKQLDAMIDLEEGKKIFIYHESLKLYVQAEEHKTSKFEGRELNILTALDMIYGMNDYGGLFLPNQEILYNLVLNLSNLAVGKEMKGEIEDYLSIFAGMLMFDDVQNMAKELAYKAVNRIQYSHLDNVHLYLLNDTYYPSSMILSNIYQALENTTKVIDLSSTKQAAKVVIDVSGADSTIASYVESHQEPGSGYTIDDWSEQRDEIMSGTKVKIIFMQSFLSFIRELSQYIQ